MTELPPIVIFTHIPKASGTTLSQMIEQTFSREELYSTDAARPKGRTDCLEKISSLARAEPRRLRVIYGHAVFGLHEALPLAAAYITVLREPVERLISHYSYVRREKLHPFHEAVRSGELTLRGFAEKLANLQTRYISGRQQGVPDEKDLESALRHLEEGYAVAGIMERFDEAAAMIQWKFGWGTRACSARNVAPMGAAPTVSEEERRALRRWHELDYELYETAVRRFDAQVEQAAEDFQVQLRAFRAAASAPHGCSGPIGWVRRILGK